MTINPTPCYLCLIYPICKTKASEMTLQTYKHTIYSQALRLSLRLSCDLYYKYIAPMENHVIGIYHRRVAVHYLTGVDIGGPKPDGYSMKELYELSNIEKEYRYDD